MTLDQLSHSGLMLACMVSEALAVRLVNAQLWCMMSEVYVVYLVNAFVYGE